jgi:uncharacterized protein (DUF1778 family)
MPSQRSSILIRCTAEEAELIRQEAKNERRTVSGFTLNVLLRYIAKRKSEGESFEDRDYERKLARSA